MPLRFLVTAGPTREPWDPVRFLSNGSSGRMGFEIARAAARRGHEVRLVAGPTNLPAPASVEVLRVTTALEMRRTVLAAWTHSDVLVMAAAVTDVRPAAPSSRKIKRGEIPRSIRLVRNPDILAEAARRKGARLLVGFALEDRLDVAEAARKMAAKDCDLLVLNTRQNLGAESGSAIVLRRNAAPVRLGRSPKRTLAARLVRLIEESRSSR